LDERVAVGTALASRPPRRSGRAVFPHPAPRSGHRGICGCRLPFRLPHSFPGPASGVWKLANGIALAPLPSLHPLRLGSDRFVRRFRRYYAAVRLPRSVHRRRQLHPSRRGLRWTAPEDCSMADEPWLSRFPHTMRLCMPRSSTPPSSYRSCQNEWQDVVFRALGPRRHSKVAPLFRDSILGLHIPCQRFTSVVAAASA